MKTFDLIRKQTAERIRAAAKGLPEGKYFSVREIEYGSPSVQPASGKGRCRCCGNRITKNARVVKFFWDFHGCGSWTATEAQIHADECQ